MCATTHPYTQVNNSRLSHDVLCQVTLVQTICTLRSHRHTSQRRKLCARTLNVWDRQRRWRERKNQKVNTYITNVYVVCMIYLIWICICLLMYCISFHTGTPAVHFYIFKHQVTHLMCYPLRKNLNIICSHQLWCFPSLLSVNSHKRRPLFSQVGRKALYLHFKQHNIWDFNPTLTWSISMR